MPDSIAALIDEFCQHKLAEEPTLPRYRGKRGSWDLNSDGVCKTEKLVREHLAKFFGWLSLDPADGGKGIAVDDLRFTMVADASLVKSYIRFLAGRSGTYAASGPKDITIHLGFISPRYGWITNQVDRFANDFAFLWDEHTPEEDIGEAIKDWLGAQHETLRDFMARIEWETDQIRRREIRSLLALDEPLKPIEEALWSMWNRRPSDHAPGLLRARHAADMFLLALLLACPLRAYTVVRLELVHLQMSDSGLSLHAPRRIFKNRKYIGPYYDIGLPDWAAFYHEHYMSLRGFLPGSASKYVFCNNSESRADPITPATVAERMAMLTREYMGMALRVHWIRHLVATVHLRRSPDAYLVVANLLNDTFETILETYGKPEARVMVKHWHDYTETFVRNPRTTKPAKPPAGPILGRSVEDAPTPPAPRLPATRR